jgi:hypothetical protein
MRLYECLEQAKQDGYTDISGDRSALPIDRAIDAARRLDSVFPDPGNKVYDADAGTIETPGVILTIRLRRAA